ncbi:DUF2891 domain-containing protein [Pseudonocardia yunnanensis]|uniref:DUF2891 family protein n=1 Tax=Pseudonocardia yunnanensis TaxID=58107 RepID=A0ABW4F9C6_9PSEU
MSSHSELLLPTDTPTDRRSWADGFAAVVVANLSRRYPYATQHETQGEDDRALPIELHPAFATSYDWHSCVHMHWLAARLLAFGVDEAVGARLEALLAENLTAANLEIEAAYLTAHPHFERPYGWAWALRLAAEVATSPVPAVRALATATTAFAGTVAGLVAAWTTSVPEPVRHGVHSNSAFALTLIVESARTLGLADLEAACSGAARRWFAGDRDWPADWERSGQDFLSPGFAEADLMRLVLPAEEFVSWCVGFLGGTAPESPIFRPVTVLDAHDGHQTHLYGLDLFRAGAATRIAGALPDDGDAGELARRLRACVPALLGAGLAASVSDEYYSTHWLATFAWEAMESIEGGARAS